MTMTASEALSLSTQDEVDDAIHVVEACLRVFDAENVTELRASILIDLLRKHENLSFTAKQLKKCLGLCGIGQHRRSDANYYLKSDFAPNPPSLHAVVPPGTVKGI